MLPVSQSRLSEEYLESEGGDTLAGLESFKLRNPRFHDANPRWAIGVTVEHRHLLEGHGVCIVPSGRRGTWINCVGVGE